MPSIDVVLRPAFASEAASLSDLALRSKGHWGTTPSSWPPAGTS